MYLLEIINKNFIAVIVNEFAHEFDRYKWGKELSNQNGFLGAPGVVPNNLIYTYNFETNHWNKFIELNSILIENYSCTTHFTKRGER